MTNPTNFISLIKYIQCTHRELWREVRQTNYRISLIYIQISDRRIVFFRMHSAQRNVDFLSGSRLILHSNPSRLYNLVPSNAHSL